MLNAMSTMPLLFIFPISNFKYFDKNSLFTANLFFKYRSRSQNTDGSRLRKRNRTRSRSQSRKRDRSRSRSRKRERSRSRKRDRSGSRSRKSDRSRSKQKKRSRSKSLERRYIIWFQKYFLSTNFCNFAFVRS